MFVLLCYVAVVVILVHELHALAPHSFECAVGEEGALYRRDVLLVGHLDVAL